LRAIFTAIIFEEDFQLALRTILEASTLDAMRHTVLADFVL